MVSPERIWKKGVINDPHANSKVSKKKLPMFVIGKSKTPLCFKHIKNLPCKYKSQKKSWMDSQIFEEWVRKHDRTFRMEGRKIALLIDNCPSEPSNQRSASFLTAYDYLSFTTDGSRFNQKPKSALSGESRTSAMQSIR